VARPIPRVPPVISATWPSNRMPASRVPSTSREGRWGDAPPSRP